MVDPDCRAVPCRAPKSRAGRDRKKCCRATRSGSYEFSAQYGRTLRVLVAVLAVCRKIAVQCPVAISEQALEQMLIFRSCDDQNFAYARRTPGSKADNRSWACRKRGVIAWKRRLLSDKGACTQSPARISLSLCPHSSCLGRTLPMNRRGYMQA